MIKLAPVIRALRARNAEVEILVTGQHVEMTDAMLHDRGLRADFRVYAGSSTGGALIGYDQSALDVLVGRIMSDCSYYVRDDYDLVLVQGDTASAFCGALLAFHHDIPIGHVEAGLRTSNLYEPFPEEMYRRAISRIATLHFAPTNRARNNLLVEKVDGKIEKTGNTIVDELDRMIEEDAFKAAASNLESQLGSARVVLVTCHRREHLQARLNHLINAVRKIAMQRPDVLIVWPVHPNPLVGDEVRRGLSGQYANVHISGALPYSEFLPLLQRAHVVVTDSGGVIEEATTLGRNLVITRDETERPEAIQGHFARLVSLTEMTTLPDLVDFLLRNSVGGRSEIFGDGHAGERIAEIIMR